MAIIANFLISPNLLIVKFTDSSTGNPTSWSWDFGDGSPLNATQNPTHTYSAAGTYTVKLIASNISGVSSVQRQLVVSTTPILPVSLYTFVTLKLPAGVNVSPELIEAYIAQWQLYIQPLVKPEVTPSNVFNELAYPPLANALIAYLAAYSIAMTTATSGSLHSASAGVNGNAGLIKKITTGPSDAEFHDIGKNQNTLYGSGGLIDTLQKELCELAFRLMISLPMCPPLPDPKVIDLKAGRKTNQMWGQYPYTISLTI